MDAAKQYPQYSSQVVAGARKSFLHGQHWAYAAGLIAVGIAMALVFFMFPKHQRERELMAGYEAEFRQDTGAPAGARPVEQAPA